MKSQLFTSAMLLISLFACNKANDTSSQTSLTASATTVTVGETVAVTLSSSANASKWTVSPSAAKQAYAITTSKINYFTFNQPGAYTVAVSAKEVSYDSTAHQSLDSCWNHAGQKACVKGVDSASVKILVTN